MTVENGSNITSTLQVVQSTENQGRPENEDILYTPPNVVTALVGLSIEVTSNGDDIDTNRRRKEKEAEANADDVLYGVNDNPPIGLTFIMGIQHVLLSIDGVIGIPLMLFGVLCFDDSPETEISKTKIIGAFFFLAGVVSFFQTTFGVRLPTAQIISLSYFVSLTALMRGEKWKCPSRIENLTDINFTWSSNVSYLYQDIDGEFLGSDEVWQIRIREAQGAIIIVGIAQIFIGASGAIGVAMRFIGPLTIGPCLFLVSFSLADVAVKFCSIYWGIPMCYILIVIVFQYLSKVNVPLPICSTRKKKCSSTKKPLFAMFPFLIALLSGWLLSYILTITNVLPQDKSMKSFRARTDISPNVISNSPWFSFPYPFQWGWPTFSISTVLIFIAALVVGIVDSLCDYYAGAKIVKSPVIPKHAINRGIMVEGFGILAHGLVGTGNATTTFASNLIGLKVTRIHSRRTLQAMGIIFAVFGLITKFCSVFVTLPLPVVGGQLCIVAGFLFSVGAGTAAYADLSNTRNMFVLGFSVFIGIAFEMYLKQYPQGIDVGITELNEIFRAILGTGMLVSSIVACILDNTMPGSTESRGLLRWQHGDMTENEKEANDSVYDLPFKTDCGWTRFIPFCPNFGKKQTEKEDEENSRL
ncbi:solute carrier family 23 member 1-like [Styela clava]